MNNTTPNTLSPELKVQIENEAIAITAKFKDNNDSQAGYRQGFEDGYDSGGGRYALKLQQAEKLLAKFISRHEAGLLPDTFIYNEIKTFLDGSK